MTPRTIRIGEHELPRIGLGTNKLRNTAHGVAFIRAAVDAGVRMIDTARLYTGGESEATIGRAAPRAFVATKGGYGDSGRGRPEVLRQEIETSLATLDVDAIALYYLHRVDRDTPIETSLGAIKAFVDRGRIQHVGLSKVDIPLIERARTVLPIAAVQNEYNLDVRESEPVVDYCTRERIVFVPYFPLQGEPNRAVRDIAKRRGVSATQVTLAWLLARSPMMLPIPGTLSIQHLRENLNALSIELTKSELASI